MIHQLTRDDLVTILTEPRNALVKQFQRFFQFDGIELVFADDSLEAIADRALERETGARGLRSILEETLLDVQFELPSRRDVKKCVVTKETIEKGLKPTLVTEAAPEEDTGEQARRVRLAGHVRLRVLERLGSALGFSPEGRPVRVWVRGMPGGDETEVVAGTITEVREDGAVLYLRESGR